MRFSGKWNSIWASERTHKVDDGGLEMLIVPGNSLFYFR